MVWSGRILGSGLYQMFKLDFARFVCFQIITQVGLAGVGIDGGAATARDDQIHAMRSARVCVVFNPMLEEMFVPGKNRAHMVGLKERHVASSKFACCRFDMRTPVRAGGEWSLMAKHEDVGVAFAVETFQLTLDPLILLLIPSNIGIERDHKGVSISEGIGRGSGETARRGIGRDEGRHSIEIVSQPHLRSRLFM